MDRPKPSFEGARRSAGERRQILPGAVPAVALALLMVPAPGPGGGGAGGAGQGPAGSFALYPSVPAAPWGPYLRGIQHVVIVMQENHAYDNYFGTYCRAFGPDCAYQGNGPAANTCEPYNPQFPKGGCYAPWAFPNSTAVPHDIVHNITSSRMAFDNGTNLGFVKAEHAGNITMGYYNGSILGDYWNAAEQYALGDNFYSSAMSYSLANHWYLLAGAAPNVSVDEYVGPTPNLVIPWSTESTYLNQSNATFALDDELLNSTVSWKYYDWPLPSTYNGGISTGAAFAYWNPLAAKAESYGKNLSGHFVARSTFFTAARNGTLPNVSWVIPSIVDSEHPPYNVTPGQQWVMNVTNAIENSPEWNSTAVFVTWDEYGGFYDHVPPPVVDGVGLSFRVPLLVISPYVRENYIGHQMGDFESLLKLVEWRFGLNAMTQRDAQTTLPLRYFDFGATPRPPINFGPALTTRYPTTLQALPAPGTPTNYTVTPVPNGLNISWTPPVGGTAVSWYRLAYHPKGTPTSQIVRVDGAADGYYLAGLAPNTSYYVTLQAVTGAQKTAAMTLNARTLAPSPARPAPFTGWGGLLATAPAAVLYAAGPAPVEGPTCPPPPRTRRGDPRQRTVL